MRGVQLPSFTTSGMLGAPLSLLWCRGSGGSRSPSMPWLNTLFVGLWMLLLNVDSVGDWSCCHGPPRRRTIRDSSDARQRCFCSAVAKDASVVVDLETKALRRSESMEPRCDLSPSSPCMVMVGTSDGTLDVILDGAGDCSREGAKDLGSGARDSAFSTSNSFSSSSLSDLVSLLSSELVGRETCSSTSPWVGGLE